MDPYATISAAASWTNVGVDAALVGVALAGIYVIFRGIRMLVGFIRK
jgi:hypothetical protein